MIGVLWDLSVMNELFFEENKMGPPLLDISQIASLEGLNF